jgi:hypothetical protein
MAGLFRQYQLAASGHLQAVALRSTQNPNLGFSGFKQVFAFNLSAGLSLFHRQLLRRLVGFQKKSFFEVADIENHYHLSRKTGPCQVKMITIFITASIKKAPANAGALRIF